MVDEWERQVFDNKHEDIQAFLQSKQTLGRSDRTLNEYSRVLKKFYHEHFPEVTPGDTEVRHIEEYVALLDDRGLSHNSKRKYLENLSAFFTWAMKRPRFEAITGNPAAVILEELPREIKDRPDCATWANATKIVQHTRNPRTKTIAVILAKTGCRLTEALKIELDDLMLDDGFIRLRVRKGGTQTVVPIDQETSRVIQRFQYIRPDAPGTDYLFVSIRGDCVGRERVRRDVRRAAVDAGIMAEGETRFHKKFTPHTFRTVFTTLMRNQGMPDHVLRYIRGDSVSEPMDIYTRVERDDARREYLDCIKPLHL